MKLLNVFLFSALSLAAAAQERITFDSSGTQIVGYRWAPTCKRPRSPQTRSANLAPAVILAHGLGGLQTSKLQPYAERFASVGYNAITFDYRYWGQSDGEPRNLPDVYQQMDDYRAAVQAVKNLSGVDAQRIVIWGTSLSGGHVLELAPTFANDSSIVAVIAQVPHVDGPATAALTPPAEVGPLVTLAEADIATINTTQPPVYVPICNYTGELGLLTAPGAFADCVYLEPNPPPPEYGNATARFVLQFPTFSPDVTAANSLLPTFIGIGLADNLVSVNATLALVPKMPNATSLELPGCGHFDVYPGKPFYEQIVAAQIAFLQMYVPVSGHCGHGHDYSSQFTSTFAA